jgi:hypothetical protein
VVIFVEKEEVAHLIPPLVGTETLNPLHVVVLHTDFTFQLPPTLTFSRRGLLARVPMAQ